MHHDFFTDDTNHDIWKNIAYLINEKEKKKPDIFFIHVDKVK